MDQNENLKIKKANEEDVSTIVDIHKVCISKQAVLDQIDTTVWLLLINENSVIGFCQYNLEGKELYQIQILPEHQEKGHRKYLYEYIEDDFIKNNKSKISLFATLNAVDFYKSVGFKPIKKIKFPLTKGYIDMIKMSKKLG